MLCGVSRRENGTKPTDAGKKKSNPVGLLFFLRKNKIVMPKDQLKPLISSAMPITAMRTANSFSNSLVSIILPVRLISAGYTNAQAMSAFGGALGQAIPLLYSFIIHHLSKKNLCRGNQAAATTQVVFHIQIRTRSVVKIIIEHNFLG